MGVKGGDSVDSPGEFPSHASNYPRDTSRPGFRAAIGSLPAMAGSCAPPPSGGRKVREMGRRCPDVRMRMARFQRPLGLNRDGRTGARRAAGCRRGLSAVWPAITGLSRIPETLAFRRGYVHAPRRSGRGARRTLRGAAEMSRGVTVAAVGSLPALLPPIKLRPAGSSSSSPPISATPIHDGLTSGQRGVARVVRTDFRVG